MNLTQSWKYLKHRVFWLTKGRRSYEQYFDSYQTRQPVIELALCELMDCQKPTIRVLEFGCSGGNNLRLMRELSDRHIEFVGFDIQPPAIEFAKRQFPHDQFVLGGVDAFLEQETPRGYFDLFIASGVLHYLPQSECDAVLAAAARMADRIVICDELSRFNAEEGAVEGLFLHPFKRLCAQNGLIISSDARPMGDASRYGIFSARPSRPFA